MPQPPSPRREIAITVSWVTILKVLTAGLVTYLTIVLWPLLSLLLLALLVAITLFPILSWTRRHGWPEWSALLIIVLLLVISVGSFAGILTPIVGNESAELIKKLPSFQHDAVALVPNPFRDAVNKLFESASFSHPEPLLERLLAWGTLAAKGVGEFLLVLVVAVYFVADGERVYRWLLAFFPETHRTKLDKASIEIGTVVGSYMLGQLITSLLCGVFVFITLTVLHVPNAALLAVIAGVFDVLPLIGFFLSIIPALIVAASVSSLATVLVFVLYSAYHLIENYFIVPKIYGDRLRLSTLTVLVSCLAGAVVAGVVGAIVVLPIVASYPIIERLWLRRHLEADTVIKHAQIDAAEHSAS